MNNKKKDLTILSILGFLAIFLLILTITLKNNEENGANSPDKIEVTTPIDEATEEESEEEVNESVPNEGLDTPSNSENVGEEVFPDGTLEEVDELDALKKPVTGKQTYTSDSLRISFDVPNEWTNYISIVEKDNFINFYFKKEHLFLELSIIPETEWEMAKEFHKSLLPGDGFRLIYAEAFEHPLANDPNSEDYKLLSKIVEGNDALLKSVKFRK